MAVRECLLSDCRALVDDAWAHPERFDATLAQAQTRLRSALADAPDDLLLLTALGAVLCDRGHARDAATTLEYAVRRGAEDHNTFFNLGVARLGCGASAEAMVAFAEARARPASPHTWTAYFDPHAT